MDRGVRAAAGAHLHVYDDERADERRPSLGRASNQIDSLACQVSPPSLNGLGAARGQSSSLKRGRMQIVIGAGGVRLARSHNGAPLGVQFEARTTGRAQQSGGAGRA